MGVAYNTNIVSENLVFCIDAGNVKSYSGTGTDLKNIGYISSTGSLTNGPVYNTNNKGIIDFDGVNDYIDFGELDLGIEAADKTMCAWIYTTSLKNLNALVDRDKDGGGGYGFWMNSSGKLWFWPRGFADIIDNGPYSVALNTWTFVTTSWDYSAKLGSFYYNGLFSSQLTSAQFDLVPPDGVRLCIGAMRNAGELPFGGNFFQGSMGNVMLYDRILTQDEITQNFNATRKRYGI